MWAKHLHDAGFPTGDLRGLITHRTCVSSCLEIDITGSRPPGRKDISLLGAVIGAPPVLLLHSDPIPFQSSVPLEHGTGYVALEWTAMVVVGVYVSLNSYMAAFEKFLDGISNCMRRCLPLQVLVLEDLNAHPLHCGNPCKYVIGRTLSD